jgi:hypothetical protein
MTKSAQPQDIVMDIFHIRVKGHLDGHWSDWFSGLTISNQTNGEAVLAGPLADQSALHGVLIKIRDLGLPLIAVCLVPAASGTAPSDGHATECSVIYSTTRRTL